MRADSTWPNRIIRAPGGLRAAVPSPPRSRPGLSSWPKYPRGGGGQTAPRDCGRGNRPQGSHFCNSVQIAVWYSSALPVQVVTNLPLSLNSAGVTISGAVFMSSGMKASDPAMPFA